MRDAAAIQAELAMLELDYNAAVFGLKFTPRYDNQRAEWQRRIDAFPTAKAALLNELHAANGRVLRRHERYECHQ